MRHISAICLFVTLGMSSLGVYAQGDSDPGLTTAGAMRNTSALQINEFEYENQRAHLSLSHAFAKGKRDVRINTTNIDARIPFFGAFSGGYFDIQVPIVAVSGELANAWGVGDVNATYTHMFLGIEDWTIQGTAGLNIGMSTANLTDGKARQLPMTYQPGKGSTDVIVGGSVTWKQYVTAAVGFQMPFFRYNDNNYFASSNSNDTLYSGDSYTVSRYLYRQGDVMMRLEGHYYNERGGITGGVVGMYHLKDDLYQDPATDLWFEIPGSQGFTLNAVGNAFVRFGRHGDFKLDVTGSIPMVRRDVIPDGTAKRWMLMPRFTYFFNSKKGALMF